MTEVTLSKGTNDTLGIVISGGSDRSHRPRVLKLRENSPAWRCDLINEGDYIVSVEGTPTVGLPHNAVVDLLRQAPSPLVIGLEYEMPARSTYASPCGNGSVIEKTVSIVLAKEFGTFGFTLRGGIAPDGTRRPLLVTHVRPGAPADREGSLKAGDRLVAVDGRDLTSCTLDQAQVALQEADHNATLAIRYDISLMDSVRLGGPLLVEIERSPGASLGLALVCRLPSQAICSSNGIKNNVVKSNATNVFAIESIRTASIAERCGALAVGDVISAVDGVRLDSSNLAEANHVLSAGIGRKVTLRVVPSRALARSRGESLASLASPLCTHRFSVYNTINNSRSRLPPSGNKTTRICEETNANGTLCDVSHRERVQFTLATAGNEPGLALRPPGIDEMYPVIAAVEPNSPAERCGLICTSDRLILVNGRSTAGRSAAEASLWLSAGSRVGPIAMQTEVGVADALTPAMGTFSVRIARRNLQLGIQVDHGWSENDNDENLVLIRDVIGGSAAHRSGLLSIGDRVLDVGAPRGGAPPTLEEVCALLMLESDPVMIKIQKGDSSNQADSSSITYSVELPGAAEGGLGVVPTGSEMPFQPIHVASLIPGGAAAQTGAIHVGDRLLEVNGVSLRGKPLSQVVPMLRQARQKVALKIARKKNISTDSLNVVNGIATPGSTSPGQWLGLQHATKSLSADSAVESWGSDGPGRDGMANNNIQQTQLANLNSDSTPEIFRSNCGSTVRRKPSKLERHLKSSGRSTPSSDSGQSASAEDATDWDQMIADLHQMSTTCGLRDRETKDRTKDFTNGAKTKNGCVRSMARESPPIAFSNDVRSHKSALAAISEGTYSITYATALHTASSPTTPVSSVPCAWLPPPPPPPVISVTLKKDPFYEDFGFSVSDGLYAKGVYINRIRQGGPADATGVLQPFDRILQVNETATEDFDCCLTVPLIASGEESLFLKVIRPTITADGNSQRMLLAPPSFDAGVARVPRRTAQWLSAEDEDDEVNITSIT